jgi:hypothetical protein
VDVGPEDGSFGLKGVFMKMPMTAFAPEPSAHSARRIVHSTRGRSGGPIVRLVSPSDVGELIKPFVFLDYFEQTPRMCPKWGFILTPASQRSR